MDDDPIRDGPMDSMGNRQMMVGKSKEKTVERNTIKWMDRLIVGKDGNNRSGSADPKISQVRQQNMREWHCVYTMSSQTADNWTKASSLKLNFFFVLLFFVCGHLGAD